MSNNEYRNEESLCHTFYYRIIRVFYLRVLHAIGEGCIKSSCASCWIAFTAFLLFVPLSVVSGAEAAPTSYLSKLEREVVRELNLARTQPQKYARFLEQWKQYYRGKLIRKPHEIAIRTREGVRAVNEAIRFLRKIAPRSALKPSGGMSLGARDHVREQALKGTTGHAGRDGSQVWDRVNRYGAWRKTVGENISYGPGTAREIVMELIVDDGVPDRGHRKNIFNKSFQVVGVGCGPHSVFNNMCVITFAGGYRERYR
jgi:uncharacterized protein YkwD